MSSDDDKNNLGLKEALTAIKREIIEAQKDEKERMFSLKEVEVELGVVFEKEANAGVQLFVFKLGGKIKSEKTHKIRLKLQPL